jgi:hypothetical protein
MIISLVMEKAPEVGDRCRRAGDRAHAGTAGHQPGEPARGETEEQQRHGLKNLR